MTYIDHVATILPRLIGSNKVVLISGTIVRLVCGDVVSFLGIGCKIGQTGCKTLTKCIGCRGKLVWAHASCSRARISSVPGVGGVKWIRWRRWVECWRSTGPRWRAQWRRNLGTTRNLPAAESIGALGAEAGVAGYRVEALAPPLWVPRGAGSHGNTAGTPRVCSSRGRSHTILSQTNSVTHLSNRLYH